MKRFENGQPCRQADRERWKNDMEGDGESELNSDRRSAVISIAILLAQTHRSA
jgi:hypothetical protein